MGRRNGSAGFSVQFTTLTFVFVRKSLGATRSKAHRHWTLQFVLYHEDTTYLSFLFREIALLTVAPHGRGKDCRRKEREIQLGEYPEQQGWRGAHQRISHPGINVKWRMAGSVCPIRLVGIGAPSNSVVSFNLVPLLYGYITTSNYIRYIFWRLPLTTAPAYIRNSCISRVPKAGSISIAFGAPLTIRSTSAVPTPSDPGVTRRNIIPRDTALTRWTSAS